MSTIHSNEDRVANLENAASTLVKENHPESETILAKSSEISHLWEELKECAQSRQEVFRAFNFFLLINILDLINNFLNFNVLIVANNSKIMGGTRVIFK